MTRARPVNFLESVPASSPKAAWIFVGCAFYQVAMERQTIAAQLETQLSHAELENLKSQLHPHFLFNSLHAIGVLMQEDVNAACRLLVSVGDLLRIADV
jgi:two-component system, LytTR family, sensor kinase